jgi:hypothetical protein
MVVAPCQREKGSLSPSKKFAFASRGQPHRQVNGPALHAGLKRAGSAASASCIGALQINLSRAFAGQKAGVKQVEEKIWLVSFVRYDLRFFDHETCRIESAENPFAANRLPMSPA